MIFKTFLTAGMAALVLAGATGSADAKKPHHPRPYVEFLDSPFGEQCMRIGRHIHCAEPRNHGNGVFRVSCGEARYRLRQHGYKNIVTKDCLGSLYAFTATKKGVRYFVKVNAYSGFLKSSAL